LWPATNFLMWKWPATLKRLGRPGLWHLNLPGILLTGFHAKSIQIRHQQTRWPTHTRCHSCWSVSHYYYYYEGGWHCMTARSCRSKENLYTIYVGRSKENLYTYAWLSHKSFHILRSSCATEDFWGGKMNAKIFDCVFQTSSRLWEFGTKTSITCSTVSGISHWSQSQSG